MAGARPDVLAGARRHPVRWAMLAFVLILVAAVLSMVRFVDAPAPAPPAPATSVDAGEVVIPVAGVGRGALVNTWGQSRAGGARAHQGTDIMAPGGTPVVAAAAGRVEKLFDSRAGGRTLYVRSADGRWSYYYAHLAGYAPGIAEGRTVRAGERIGFVGDTGNAGAGNHHLHFGMNRMQAGERWWQGEPVNPYPWLVGGDTAR